MELLATPNLDAACRLAASLGGDVSSGITPRDPLCRVQRRRRYLSRSPTSNAWCLERSLLSIKLRATASGPDPKCEIAWRFITKRRQVECEMAKAAARG